MREQILLHYSTFIFNFRQRKLNMSQIYRIFVKLDLRNQKKLEEKLLKKRC